MENPIKFVYYSSDNAEDMFINEVQALIDKNGNKIVSGIVDLPIVIPHSAAGIAVLGFISPIRFD